MKGTFERKWTQRWWIWIEIHTKMEIHTKTHKRTTAKKRNKKKKKENKGPFWNGSAITKKQRCWRFLFNAEMGVFRISFGISVYSKRKMKEKKNGTTLDAQKLENPKVHSLKNFNNIFTSSKFCRVYIFKYNAIAKAKVLFAFVDIMFYDWKLFQHFFSLHPIQSFSEYRKKWFI